jgi:hypothetical protein
MTDLRKPVRRVSRGLIREAGKVREVVVILRPPNVLGFRAKGCRKEYQLTAEACYTMAVKASVLAQKRLKKQKRKANR